MHLLWGGARNIVVDEPETPALGRAPRSRSHQPATRQARTSQVARVTAEGFGRMFVKPRMGATRSMFYLERSSCWSDASENRRMILLHVAKLILINRRRERSAYCSRWRSGLGNSGLFCLTRSPDRIMAGRLAGHYPVSGHHKERRTYDGQTTRRSTQELDRYLRRPAQAAPTRRRIGRRGRHRVRATLERRGGQAALRSGPRSVVLHLFLIASPSR